MWNASNQQIAKVVEKVVTIDMKWISMVSEERQETLEKDVRKYSREDAILVQQESTELTGRTLHLVLRLSIGDEGGEHDVVCRASMLTIEGEWIIDWMIHDFEGPQIIWADDKFAELP